MEGDYKVVVTKTAIDAQGEKQNLLPKVYSHANVTPLQATVSKGKNVFAFDVSSR